MPPRSPSGGHCHVPCSTQPHTQPSGSWAVGGLGLSWKFPVQRGQVSSLRRSRWTAWVCPAGGRGAGQGGQMLSPWLGSVSALAWAGDVPLGWREAGHRSRAAGVCPAGPGPACLRRHSGLGCSEGHWAVPCPQLPAAPPTSPRAAGNHEGCWPSGPGQPHAREVPCPLDTSPARGLSAARHTHALTHAGRHAHMNTC